MMVPECNWSLVLADCSVYAVDMPVILSSLPGEVRYSLYTLLVFLWVYCSVP